MQGKRAVAVAAVSVSVAEPTTEDWTVAGHRARRSERFALREAGRAVVLDQRVKSCGLLPTRSTDGGWTVLRAEVEGEQVAQVHGPGLCGNVRLCGWCGGPIRKKRGEEIEDAVVSFLGARRGGSVWLVTSTTGPVDGEDMAASKARMVETYQAWSDGGRRARWNARFGLVFSHRTLEETITPETRRCHWHFHTLLWMDGLTPENEAVALIELRRMWIDAAEARGAAVNWKHGFDVLPIQLNEDGSTSGVGSYVTKSVGVEATRGDMKRSRGESFAPHELIRAFAETGDLAYRHAHMEWEQAGGRVGPFRWSRNWRRKLDAWLAGAAVVPDDPVVEDRQVDELDEDEVPEALIAGARPVAHIDAHAARWFASKRMFSAVHLVAEAAPTDDLVPEYLRALASSSGAPGFVLDGIGPPVE